MKKCLKCNSELKLSPHNQMTGYESYRCTNSNCKALFDVSDFKINTLNNKLIKPSNLKFNQGDYFDKLINENKVEIPIGAGKSYLVMRILEENDRTFGVFQNQSIVKHVSMATNSPIKLNNKIYVACSHLLNSIVYSDDFIKNYDNCILDDLDLDFNKKIIKVLEKKGFDINNIFIFKSRP